MDNPNLKDLWPEIWLGLSPKSEIIGYIWDEDDRMKQENLYDDLLNRKNEMIERSSVDRSHFDRLDRVFRTLNKKGIISIHIAGSTMNDSFSTIEAIASDIYREVTEQNLRFDVSTLKGYCFYHQQDIECLIPERDSDEIPVESFYIAFGPLGNVFSSQEIAEQVSYLLKSENIAHSWNGDPKSRILLKDFVWAKENDGKEWRFKAQEEILESFRVSEKPQEYTFETGQEIVILGGPFVNFPAIVQAVNEAERTLEVEAMVFGRKTPATIEFRQATSLQ